MNRTTLVLAAVIPALVIAGLMLGVVAWRTHTQAEEKRAQAEQEQKALERMRQLGEQLSAQRADTQKWHDQWEADTKRLTGQLDAANTALAASVKEREQAKTEMDALAKQIAELGEQIKSLQAKPPPTPDKNEKK